MALSKLDSLYMAVVADHSKNPHHQGKLEDAEQISLNNPTCGDVINLSVKFDTENRLEISLSKLRLYHLNCLCKHDDGHSFRKNQTRNLRTCDYFSEMVQGQKMNAKTN